MSNQVAAVKTTASVNATDRYCRKLFLEKMKQLEFGALTIKDDLGTTTVKGEKNTKLATEVIVHDLRTYRLLAMRGALGGAEAYMAGLWDSSSLYDFVRIMVLNQDILSGFEGGWAILQKPIESLLYFLSRNTLSGSEKNIRAHYDLSNDLFSTFLDSKMMYSCAYFENEDDTIEEASEKKLKLVCDKMNLSPNDHVLEIGTGWGGFALYAAENYGCKVTTTTISKEQHAYAAKLIAEKGLQNKITLLLKDYRLLEGKYDKVVSIEMIEAVGADFLDNYISKCSSLLKEDGALFLQAITINDQIYDRALKEVDFIKKYIFPGSFIPSISAIHKAATESTDLRFYHLQDLTPHYAKTLLEWRERLFANKIYLGELGFDETFMRKWDYYFCYCAGGFAERSIGSTHLIFGKPLYRGDLGNVTKESN